MVNFTPSRRAPSPPFSPANNFYDVPASLPPNHPFATYYIPPRNTFSSKAQTKTKVAATPYSYSAYSTSDRSLASPRSPTSSFAQPLTPPRKNAVRISGSSTACSVTSSSSSFGAAYPDDHDHSHRYPTYPNLGHHNVASSYGQTNKGHFATQPLEQTRPPHGISSSSAVPHPSYSRYSPPASPTVYDTLPTELTLFDHRPKQSLLADVEYIIGKKMSFPFLNAFTRPCGSGSGSGSSGLKKEKKDKKIKEEKKKLMKKQVVEEGWEFWGDINLGSAPNMGEKEVFEVGAEKQREGGEKRKSGRGVREGNWV
ncbi:hypothetical protein IAT40_007149 [Kwoniella sp. CBS 6097]